MMFASAHAPSFPRPCASAVESPYCDSQSMNLTVRPHSSKILLKYFLNYSRIASVTSSDAAPACWAIASTACEFAESGNFRRTIDDLLRGHAAVRRAGVAAPVHFGKHGTAYADHGICRTPVLAVEPAARLAGRVPSERVEARPLRGHRACGRRCLAGRLARRPPGRPATPLRRALPDGARCRRPVSPASPRAGVDGLRRAGRQGGRVPGSRSSSPRVGSRTSMSAQTSASA